MGVALKGAEPIQAPSQMAGQLSDMKKNKKKKKKKPLWGAVNDDKGLASTKNTGGGGGGQGLQGFSAGIQNMRGL